MSASSTVSPINGRVHGSEGYHDYDSEDDTFLTSSSSKSYNAFFNIDFNNFTSKTGERQPIKSKATTTTTKKSGTGTESNLEFVNQFSGGECHPLSAAPARSAMGAMLHRIPSR